MRKCQICVVICLISLLYSTTLSYALDVLTHQTVNTYIVNKTINGFSVDDFLRNSLEFTEGKEAEINGKKVYKWFSDGGRFEDKPPWTLPYVRSSNHFHNPITDKGFSGVMGVPILLPGQSTVEWAQRSTGTQSPGGYFSWFDARSNYHLALTSKDLGVREDRFGKVFRGLGQLMHLVQDMSVPEHVRDDGHYSYAYEEWLVDKRNAGIVAAALSNPIYPDAALLNKLSPFSSAAVPIANLFDSNTYTGENPAITLTTYGDPMVIPPQKIGLSEYTNANYFSPDTAFKSGFPHPALTSVAEYEDPVDQTSGKVRTYLKKSGDGEVVNHLAATRWLYRYLPAVSKGLGVTFDSKVYNEYATKLLPRAVGYSAALLGYFFRGTLEISPPDQYVYAITDESQTPYAYTGPSGTYQEQAFTQIKAKVKNTTLKEKDAQGNILSYEEAQAGELVAVARYKRRTDYTTTLSTDPPTAASRENNYTYSVSTPLAVSALSTTPTEYTFDFSASPVPAGITDLSLQVVFKGTLGGEAEKAVAVGSKDLMEPVQQTVWNLTDMFSLNYHLYTAEAIKADPELAALVDLDHDGVFSEVAEGEAFIDPLDIIFDVSYSGTPSFSSSSPSASINIAPGRYARLIVLVDRESSNFMKIAWVDPVGVSEWVESFDETVSQDKDGIFS